MKIYIVGAACVGKTTVGRLLATRLQLPFYDLDEEVEKYYIKPIEKLQNECFSMNGFREKASVVLDKLLEQEEDAVIAGTPSGLRNAYLRVYKKHKKSQEIYSVHLIDTPANIMERLVFYDVDSKIISIEINAENKKKYLQQIEADMNYFKKSLARADFQISIENIPLDEISTLIINQLDKISSISR